MRAALAPLAARWLRCPDTNLIGAGVAIDENGRAEEGRSHVRGVSSACRAAPEVENCVTTVFTSYVTTTGSCWVDFDVYFPKPWASDPERRTAGVPYMALVTKPDLAAAQITRLVATGVPLGSGSPATRCTGDQPAYAADDWAWPTCSARPSYHHLITGPHTGDTTAVEAAKNSSIRTTFVWGRVERTPVLRLGDDRYHLTEPCPADPPADLAARPAATSSAMSPPPPTHDHLPDHHRRMLGGGGNLQNRQRRPRLGPIPGPHPHRASTGTPPSRP